MCLADEGTLSLEIDFKEDLQSDKPGETLMLFIGLP